MAKKTSDKMKQNVEEPTVALGVYGAAGSLGEQILVACEGEGIGLEPLIPIGSTLSVAEDIPYQGKSWRVQTPASVQPSLFDAAVVAIPEDSAKTVVQSLQNAGIFTVDASGAAHSLFPITWPVRQYTDAIDEAGGVTIPGPIASTVAPLLQKLSAAGRISSLHIVVLLTAGSQGKTGPPTLSSQTLDLLNFRIPETSDLGGMLAFNILPDTAPTSERNKSRARREISALVPDLCPEQIHVQCLRVPVFSGIACALHVEFEEELTDSALSVSTTAQSELVIGSSNAGLRECLESDSVLVSSFQRPDDKSVDCICFADPIHRTANAVGKMLQLFAQEGL